MNTTHLQGFDQLDQKLHELGEVVARDLLVASTREGANVIRDDARQRASKKEGILARDINTRMRGRKKGSVIARIGTTSRAWYARLVEYGTAPHEIRVKVKKALADVATGALFGRKVQHPGAAPKPFLRPALETKKEEAVAVLGRALWRGIAKVAGKVA